MSKWGVGVSREAVGVSGEAVGVFGRPWGGVWPDIPQAPSF